MPTWIRWPALLVFVIGIVSLVSGIVFIVLAGTMMEKLAEEIKPLTTSQLQGSYDQAKGALGQLRAAGDTASVRYAIALASKVGLANSLSSLALASVLRIAGIVNLLMGLALAAVGVVLWRAKTVSG